MHLRVPCSATGSVSLVTGYSFTGGVLVDGLSVVRGKFVVVLLGVGRVHKGLELPILSSRDDLLLVVSFLDRCVVTTPVEPSRLRTSVVVSEWRKTTTRSAGPLTTTCTPPVASAVGRSATTGGRRDRGVTILRPTSVDPSLSLPIVTTFVGLYADLLVVLLLSKEINSRLIHGP